MSSKKNKKPFFCVINSKNWNSKEVPSFQKAKDIVDESRFYDHVGYFDGKTFVHVYDRENGISAHNLKLVA